MIMETQSSALLSTQFTLTQKVRRSMAKPLKIMPTIMQPMSLRYLGTICLSDPCIGVWREMRVHIKENKPSQYMRILLIAGAKG